MLTFQNVKLLQKNVSIFCQKQLGSEYRWQGKLILLGFHEMSTFFKITAPVELKGHQTLE